MLWKRLLRPSRVLGFQISRSVGKPDCRSLCQMELPISSEPLYVQSCTCRFGRTRRVSNMREVPQWKSEAIAERIRPEQDRSWPGQHSTPLVSLQLVHNATLDQILTLQLPQLHQLLVLNDGNFLSSFIRELGQKLGH